VTEALDPPRRGDALEPAAAGDEVEGASDRPKGVRNAVEWIAIVVGALAVALLVKTFLIQAFYIPSGSMLPTLHLGDRVLVNKLDDEPSRGELVVFERPPGTPDDGIKDLIKRVVALGGQTVEARNGLVYVDGKPLDEPYVKNGGPTDGLPLERQTIPEGYVFVMGDNRGDSSDSRAFGPIDEDLIVGKAFVRVWPLGDLGFL
jgi:signal peptidase I